MQPSSDGIFFDEVTGRIGDQNLSPRTWRTQKHKQSQSRLKAGLIWNVLCRSPIRTVGIDSLELIGFGLLDTWFFQASLCKRLWSKSSSLYQMQGQGGWNWSDFDGTGNGVTGMLCHHCHHSAQINDELVQEQCLQKHTIGWASSFVAAPRCWVLQDLGSSPFGPERENWSDLLQTRAGSKMQRKWASLQSQGSVGAVVVKDGKDAAI